MNCPHCDEVIHESDYHCPVCGKLTARSREDLSRIDVQTSKSVAWALIAMSLLGFIFVVVNSQQEWYSLLNFVAPVIVLLAGIGSLIWINAKSKR